MVRPFNECHYCNLIDSRGLLHSEELHCYAVCRDCVDKIPTYIPEEQYHDYLMETIYGKRTTKM